MKLQQKLESSLDDIIKTSKKKPAVSGKSKAITRPTDKIKRLKQLNRKGPKTPEARAARGQKTQKPGGAQRGPTPQNRNSAQSKPRNQQGRPKWTGPKRAPRFNRNFRGRNRN